MQPYDTLTDAGKVRRLRALAARALERWEARGARLTLLQHSDTTTFRVEAEVPGVAPLAPYPSGRYLLRLHRPGFESEASIASELAWLDALVRETELVVPCPVRTRDGATVVGASAPGVPDRLCTLLRWVPGRCVARRATPAAFHRLGACLAVLHVHAAGWTRPPGFKRRAWDAPGIFNAADGAFDEPGHGVRDLIAPPHAGVFEAAIAHVEGVMTELGRGRDVWRLLHADLHPEHVPVRGRALQVIDFADCGEGYLVYDFAVPLEFALDDEGLSKLRAALFAGYATRGPRPDEQLAHLDAFIVARGVGNAVWLAGIAPDHAGYASKLDAYVERQSRRARAFLDAL